MSMINEFVEKLIEKFKDGSDLSFINLNRAIRIANQLAEEYKDVPDTNVGKWIPVSEKLPDDFMSYEYLTIRKGQTLATITYYCVVNHKWYSNRKSTKEIDVIAWQHLPEPYKGE